MLTKVALLEPSSGIRGCHTYAGHNEFEPIGLEYIAAVLIKAGYRVRVFRQGSLSTEGIVDAIANYAPSILGFSVMTHAANSALAIAAEAKTRIAGLRVVAGGYHPSGDPEFVLNSSIDFSVIGEGETTFLELIKCLEEGTSPADVKGICYRRDGQAVRTEPRLRTTDLDSLPRPLRSEDSLSPARMYGLMLPPTSKQHNVAILMSSRGCPNSCSFCCSRSVWGRKVIFRRPESVAEELRQVIADFNTNAFFLSDLTFNCSKKHVLALCKTLKKLGDVPPWYAMCTISDLTEDTIEAMRGAGCRKIGFGVESLSDSTLKRIRKKTSAIRDHTNHVLEACDRNGILTKAYLMVGYPWETTDSLAEFSENLLELAADEIRISYFTPFPGCTAFDECRDNLVTHDWSKYNAVRDIVLRNTNGVTTEMLQDIRVSSFRRFYNNSAYHDRVEHKVRCHLELKEPFEEFFAFLAAGDVLTHKQTWTETLARS